MITLKMLMLVKITQSMGKVMHVSGKNSSKSSKEAVYDRTYIKIEVQTKF